MKQNGTTDTVKAAIQMSVMIQKDCQDVCDDTEAFLNGLDTYHICDQLFLMCLSVCDYFIVMTVEDVSTFPTYKYFGTSSRSCFAKLTNYTIIDFIKI